MKKNVGMKYLAVLQRVLASQTLLHYEVSKGGVSSYIKTLNYSSLLSIANLTLGEPDHIDI